jgi:carbonic anhydrase
MEFATKAAGAGRIRETSAVIRELESANKVKIAGAMYNLATAKMDFLS